MGVSLMNFMFFWRPAIPFVCVFHYFYYVFCSLANKVMMFTNLYQRTVGLSVSVFCDAVDNPQARQS